MPSRVVVSLISRVKDLIGDDFVVRQKSDKNDKEGNPSRGARKGLKRICSKRTMSKISRDSN